MPASIAVSAHSRSSRLTRVTISEAGGSERHSSGRPRMCISTPPHFSSAKVRFICGSHRNPLTSFTTSAPALTAALATFARYVSTEITASGCFRFSSEITGRMRSSSSCSLTDFLPGFPELAPDSPEPSTNTPGLVDTPPTSIISAPSARSRNP